MCEWVCVHLAAPPPWPAQDEAIKRRKVPPVDEMLLARGLWRLCFWVRVKGLCRRAVVFGLVHLVMFGVPAVIIAAMALGSHDGSVDGVAYCYIKATFAALVGVAVFPGMFVSAISTDKFRGSAHQGLLATPSTSDSYVPVGGAGETASLVRLDFGASGPGVGPGSGPAQHRGSAGRLAVPFSSV